MTIAATSNLSKGVSQELTDKLTRFRLLGDISRQARTNRSPKETPPAAEEPNVVDLLKRLK
jgi:hypothetical protein